jgi:diguanylate cyclase
MRPAANDAARDPALAQPQGLALVRRSLGPRFVGVWLCGACIVPSLLEQPANPWHWMLAPYFMLVWPLLAYRLAVRSRQPLKAELTNLWLDAAHAGFWAAAMQFSLVPTLALFMATSLSNVTVGGWRWMGRAFTGHLAGALLGVLVWGAQFHPASSLAVQLWSVPLLLFYPLLMGHLMYGLASRLKQSRRELRYLSEHDALSGVHNRRFFDAYLRQTFAQFQRHHRPVTLLIFDIDHFKQINDQHGHAVGDLVIQQLATSLVDCARNSDVVARLGGDEFVVLLADADLAQAQSYAERVQAHLKEAQDNRGLGFEATVSFGAAQADPRMKNHDQWLEQADRSLYADKDRRPALHPGTGAGLGVAPAFYRTSPADLR